MAKRVWNAGDSLVATGASEVFEYRRADDREKGKFTADFPQYAPTEEGLKAALAVFGVTGVVGLMNAELLATVQGKVSGKSGKEKRVANEERAKVMAKAATSTDPQILAALKLIQGLK